MKCLWLLIYFPKIRLQNRKKRLDRVLLLSVLSINLGKQMVYRGSSFYGDKGRIWVEIATALFCLEWNNGVRENYIDSSCIVGWVLKSLAGGLGVGGEDREELMMMNKFLAWETDERWCYLLKAGGGRVNRFVGCGLMSSVWEFLSLRSLWVIQLVKSNRMLNIQLWSHLH